MHAPLMRRATVIGLSATVLATSAVALALHCIPRISGVPDVPAVRTALLLAPVASPTDSVELTDAAMSEDPSATESAVPDTLQTATPPDALSAPAVAAGDPKTAVTVTESQTDSQREVVVPEPYETLDVEMGGDCGGGVPGTGTKPTGDRH